MSKTVETRAWRMNGFHMIGVVLLLLAAGIYLFVDGIALAPEPVVAAGVTGGVLVAAALFLALGFTMVQPNESRVLIFFGNYSGTVRDAGFYWVNPLAIKTRVSLRVRNFNSGTLKVNDAHGNPIEIGSVVVWRVVDTARATFDVDDYEEFVAIQAETAIRALASSYPYDSPDDSVPSLRGIPEEIAESMKRQVQERLQAVGVEVLEARLNHLSYAKEIAQVMLRRQQADAVIAAREKIVEGAVGMVEMALQRFEDQQLIKMDDERKAAMINNLMVSLVADGDAQPVINTGSLYT